MSRPIRRTRLRLRLQRSLEAAVSLAVVWVFAAAVAVCLQRVGLLELRAVALICAAGAALPLGAALVGAMRRVSALQAARLIDNSHGLHDRLRSALELGRERPASSFVAALVADACRAAATVDPSRALPWRWPRRLRALALAVVCAGLAVLLRFPAPLPQTSRPPEAPRLVVAAEDLEPQRERLEALRQEAAQLDQPEASELAAALNRLFDEIEQKQLNRQTIFARLAELERKYFDGLANDFEALQRKLRKMGGELEKEPLSRELGESLKRAELERARREMEALARAAERLVRPEQRRLSRSLERAAQQKLEDKDLQRRHEQLEQRSRRLQRQLQQQPRQAETRRRLERQRRELERLNRERRERAEQGRQLERLNRELQRAAQNLRNSLNPEARRALEQAARELGRFARQQTRLGLMGKAQAQLADLKELLRRLGQGGGLERGGKLQDFLARARGQKPGRDGKLDKTDKSGAGGTGGQEQGNEGKKLLVLKPGGSSGPTALLPLSGAQGAGQEDPHGSPGDGIGSGTDPDLLGKSTRLDGRRRTVQVQGQHGAGPTRSEVILGAAEQGFASRDYRRVYQDYSQIIEEALKHEDVPLGYRYYVKRYFELIRPR